MPVNFLKHTPSFSLINSLTVLSMAIVFAFPIITDIAGANAPDASIVLDAHTIDRGYTITTPDEQFKLGVLPRSVASDHIVINIQNVTSLHQLLPLYKKLASDIFLFEIQNANTHTLETPLMVSVKLKEHQHAVHLYYWDKGLFAWKQLPSQIDVTQTHVYGRIPFSSGLVAAFSSELIMTQTIKSKIFNEVLAPSYILIDKQSNDVLLEKDAHIQRPIASLTKLMTALVFLDHNPGWSTDISIKREDLVGGASLPLREGDIVSVKDLYYATLIGSKNNATMALARSTGLSKEEFVQKMNEKAQALGMENTVFIEPTGLSSQNRSTASDISLLAVAAFNEPIVADISSMTEYDVLVKNANKSLRIDTTNKLLHDPTYPITAGKTGFTNDANHCLITQLHLHHGTLISIVLGSPSFNGHFQDTKTIFHAMMLENN